MYVRTYVFHTVLLWMTLWNEVVIVCPSLNLKYLLSELLGCTYIPEGQTEGCLCQSHVLAPITTS